MENHPKPKAMKSCEIGLSRQEEGSPKLSRGCARDQFGIEVTAQPAPLLQVRARFLHPSPALNF